jgi:hypothetical protein
MKYYIENVGGSELDQAIGSLRNNGTPIWEHPGMKCLDRRGSQIIRNLWEVPRDVSDKIQRMARNSGFQFVVYRSVGDELPRDHVNFSFPVRIDPFKKTRRIRHRIGLPKGVFRGSRLMGA